MERPVDTTGGRGYRPLTETTRPLPVASGTMRSTGGPGGIVRTSGNLKAGDKMQPVSVTAMPPGTGYGLWQKEPRRDTTFYLVISGFVMFAFAVALPFTMAIQMLLDEHFVYWFGAMSPVVLLLVCLILPCAFAGTIAALSDNDLPGIRSEETMVLTGATFASLLGVILALMALPLASQTSGTISGLTFGCDISNPMASNLVQYSKVLHTIRATPECQKKPSVSMCEGYASNKYTEYLRVIEGEFRCTGMCKLPSIPSMYPSLAQEATATLGHRTNKTRSMLALKSSKSATVSSDSSSIANPPAYQMPKSMMLFSRGSTDRICFPMVADRLHVTVGTTGDLLFWQGMGLIIVSIAAGTTKVLDQCFFQKDLDRSPF